MGRGASTCSETGMCETRWSSRAEAVKAICIGLGELVGLLEKLSDDTNDKELRP